MKVLKPNYFTACLVVLLAVFTIGGGYLLTSDKPSDMQLSSDSGTSVDVSTAEDSIDIDIEAEQNFTSNSQGSNTQNSSNHPGTSSAGSPFIDYGLPTRDFDLILSEPPANSGNAFGFLIKVVQRSEGSDFGLPRPVVASAPNGFPCVHYEDGIYYVGGSVYPENYQQWGWVCNPIVMQDGTMPYGEYPITFSATLENGDGNGGYITRHASAVIIYHPDQVKYENIIY